MSIIFWGMNNSKHKFQQVKNLSGAVGFCTLYNNLMDVQESRLTCKMCQIWNICRVLILLITIKFQVIYTVQKKYTNTTCKSGMMMKKKNWSRFQWLQQSHHQKNHQKPRNEYYNTPFTVQYCKIGIKNNSLAARFKNWY